MSNKLHLNVFGPHLCGECGGPNAALHFPGGWLCSNCIKPDHQLKLPEHLILSPRSQAKKTDELCDKDEIRTMQAKEACIIGTMTRKQLRDFICEVIEQNEFLRGPTGPMGPPGECKPDQWRCMSDVNMDLVKPEPRWSWHPIIQQPEPGELGLKLFLSGALVRV